MIYLVSPDCILYVINDTARRELSNKVLCVSGGRLFGVENDPRSKIFFASGGAAQAAGPLVKKPRTPPGWP